MDTLQRARENKGEVGPAAFLGQHRREFADLQAGLGEVLHEHADYDTPSPDIVRRQALDVEMTDSADSNGDPLPA